jgi:hypothetical protein
LVKVQYEDEEEEEEEEEEEDSEEVSESDDWKQGADKKSISSEL